MRDSLVRSLGWEDPLEKEMATHSSTLACKIPWTEEPGRLQSMGLQSQTQLSDFTFNFRFHALEKEMATHSSILAWKISMGRGTWQATVRGVAKSWTRLSFPGGSDGKESTCNVGDLGSIPGSGRFPG